MQKQGKGVRVPILHSYCDESSDGERKRVYIMAGYVGTEATWQDFTHRWESTLKEAELIDFHMADCENGSGQFKGKERAEREDLQRQFIKIITDSPLLGSVGGIRLTDYNALKSIFKKQRTIPIGLSISGSLEDPYFLAFQYLLEITLKNTLAANIPADQPIGFVFDRHQHSARAQEVYKSVRGSAKLGFMKRLDSDIYFKSRFEAVPLQAADVLAYEFFRYEDERNPHDEHSRRAKPTRWQWKEICKQVPAWYILDKAGLEVLIRNEQGSG